MKITSCAISDIGKKREENQDDFLLDDTMSIFVVADGMGGHLGGEVASATAVATMAEAFTKLVLDPQEVRRDWKAATSAIDAVETRLKLSIRLACRAIYDKARSDPANLRDMGTTVVAIALAEGHAAIAHVGDSRAHLVRGGTIVQLTEDHSMVAAGVRAGVITSEDAKGHRMKNVLYRSVGFQEDVEVDVGRVALEAGDVLMLCSDGLSNMVEPDEIAKACSEADLESAAERLVALANEHGGDDNITVLMVRVDSLE